MSEKRLDTLEFGTLAKPFSRKELAVKCFLRLGMGRRGDKCF
jgi:hypothetical protein